MTLQLNKPDKRQAAYRKRASRARGLARIMMPVVGIVLATGAWQDPDLGPRLAAGLENIRPTAASYLVDTPLENILGPVFGDEIV